MNGTVKFFNSGKGFGFITAEDDKEYFVHITGLQDGVQIADGDTVTFDVEDGERGPKAVNVAVGSAEASSEESADEPESTEEFGDDEE